MNEQTTIKILQRIDDLEHELKLLGFVHQKLLSEVRQQNKLIEEIIEDSKDDWWKNGGNPEWE